MARLEERDLAGLPWLVLRADDGPAAFRALGQHAGAEIRHAVERWPDAEALRRRLARPGQADRFTALLAATRAAEPEACRELEALAAGAGVEPAELYALNFRGDLGADGTGCSDVLVAGERPLLGHTEDGDAAAATGFGLITLVLPGRPRCTSLWYPGFLGSNAWTLTEHASWGIDNVPVDVPGPGPGRHFVARSAQQVGGVAELAAFLGDHPGAGGFAYNVLGLQRPDGRFETAGIETAAGQTSVAAVAAGSAWHTNHLQRLPQSCPPGPSSTVRGEWLGERLQTAPDAPRLADLLDAPYPDGVRRTGREPGDVLTLARVVVDPTERRLLLGSHLGQRAEIDLDTALAR